MNVLPLLIMFFTTFSTPSYELNLMTVPASKPYFWLFLMYLNNHPSLDVTWPLGTMSLS